MDLILWRHAEAEDAAAGLSDDKRRLTSRGEKQARDVAKWLRPRMGKKFRILVSPTARTQQTAHALALPFEIETKIAPGASPEDLIAATDWPAPSGVVVLVGHQPTLGQLAARLMTGAETDWNIKKGAVWWFSHRNRDGVERVQLRAVVNPDML